MLVFASSRASGASIVDAVGGRILQDLGDGLLDVELPPGVALDAVAGLDPAPSRPLSAVMSVAVDAWRRRQASTLGKLELPHDVSFGRPARQAKSFYFHGAPMAELGVTAIETPPETLVGRVGVGVIIASPDQGNLRLDDQDVGLVLEYVGAGLDLLARAEPKAKVSFVHDIEVLHLPISAGPYAGDLDQFEAYERDWRDAALAALGHPGGDRGLAQHVRSLKTKLGTDTAFPLLVCPLELADKAYAIPSSDPGSRVVVYYPKGEPEARLLPSYVAHEVCHVFGAADEYGDCRCGEQWGLHHVPNNNCRNCHGPKQACLMKNLEPELCEWTRRQLGWPWA